MTVLTVKTHWRDNNGNRAQMWLRPAVTDSYSGAAAVINPILEACVAVSDAILLKVEYEWEIELPESIPGAGATVSRAMVIFYRNGENISSLLVPSPVVELAETAGDFAGIRITRESAAAAGLLTVLENITTGLLDPIERPYGTEFIIGTFTAP